MSQGEKKNGGRQRLLSQALRDLKKTANEIIKCRGKGGDDMELLGVLQKKLTRQTADVETAMDMLRETTVVDATVGPTRL